MTKPDQAGWYDDPNDANAQRFWDGRDWTPHRQRRATPAQAAPLRPPPAQPPQIPPPSRAPAPPWMPPPPPPPVGGPSPWERVRPYVNKARDDGRQFWSHQSRQRKITWALAGAAAAIVAVTVLAFTVGSLGIFGGGSSSSGGKSNAAFCAELNSLWDGGVRKATLDVDAARQAGTQPFISKAELEKAAKNAQKLADDAPPGATAEGTDLKSDFTLIAQELSAAAAGNITSLDQLANDEAVTVWQAANCNALTGNP